MAKNQSNPIDINTQCRRKLFEVESKIDAMLANIQHTNKMINELLPEAIYSD